MGVPNPVTGSQPMAVSRPYGRVAPPRPTVSVPWTMSVKRSGPGVGVGVNPLVEAAKRRLAGLNPGLVQERDDAGEDQALAEVPPTPPGSSLPPVITWHAAPSALTSAVGRAARWRWQCTA